MNAAASVFQDFILTLTIMEVVGMVQKIERHLCKEEGGIEKAHTACPLGPGLEPGTQPMLGGGPQLHATAAVSLSVPMDRIRMIARHRVRRILESLCKIV